MSLSFNDKKQQQKLADLRQKEEEDLAKLLSEKYGVPYLDLAGISIDTEGLRLIPEETAKKAKVAIFSVTGKRIRIAVLSPNRDETLYLIKDLEKRGYVVEPFVVSNQGLEKAWSRYKDISFATESKAGSLEISNKEIENFISEVKSIEDAKKLIEETLQMKKSFKISRIVEIVVAGAIATNASDIHAEPQEDGARIRFRVDGILTDIIDIDTDTFRLLLSRIKLLSGMKLNIKDSSQDGRFSIKIGEEELEIRSSIIPGSFSESIVLRVLNPDQIQVGLEQLGIEKYLLDILMKELKKPNGLILNTGPTGSGKTTTLYAFMREKLSPEIKIITIEDPIEYHLKGVLQTQVDNKKGYDFASGLKSALRQDPDVIMVGEIRDFDTAETAVQSAMTGHLVFSTLHTNTAAGAFTRLIDLGINSKVLTSAIRVAIAQRLVRKLCENCKKEITLEGDALEKVRSVYDSIKNPILPWSEKIYGPGEGCEKCNKMKYKGRIAIMEAVLSDSKIEEVLQFNPSEREVRKAAEDQEIMDMAQDGVIKILRGTTSVEELERVVDLEKREAQKTLPSEENGFQELSNEDLLSGAIK